MSTKRKYKSKRKYTVNKPKFNEKNTTKFNNTNTNFNERTTNTLNQQQDAINKTLDNVLNNVKRTTDEGAYTRDSKIFTTYC